MKNPEILVIGLGNPLRRDDGIGSEVVKMLGRQLPPPVKSRVDLRVDFQADLFHAQLIRGYKSVIFIDAQSAGDCPPAAVQKLEAACQAPGFTSHIGSIPGLLNITKMLYGKTPDCYLLAVRGRSFDLGEELSAEGKENCLLGVKAAAGLIHQLLPLS